MTAKRCRRESTVNTRPSASPCRCFERAFWFRNRLSDRPPHGPLGHSLLGCAGRPHDRAPRRLVHCLSRELPPRGLPPCRLLARRLQRAVGEELSPAGLCHRLICDTAAVTQEDLPPRRRPLLSGESSRAVALGRLLSLLGEQLSGRRRQGLQLVYYRPHKVRLLRQADITVWSVSCVGSHEGSRALILHSYPTLLPPASCCVSISGRRSAKAAPGTR